MIIKLTKTGFFPGQTDNDVPTPDASSIIDTEWEAWTSRIEYLKSMSEAYTVQMRDYTIFGPDPNAEPLTDWIVYFMYKPERRGQMAEFEPLAAQYVWQNPNEAAKHLMMKRGIDASTFKPYIPPAPPNPITPNQLPGSPLGEPLPGQKDKYGVNWAAGLPVGAQWKHPGTNDTYELRKGGLGFVTWMRWEKVA